MSDPPIPQPATPENVTAEDCALLIRTALSQESTLAPIAEVMNKISHSLPPQNFEELSYALMDNGTAKLIIEILENAKSPSEKCVDGLLVVSHLLPAKSFRKTLLKHPKALARMSELMNDDEVAVGHAVVQVVSLLMTGMKTADLEVWEECGSVIEAATRYLQRRPIEPTRVMFGVFAARCLHVFVLQNSALGSKRILESKAIAAYIDFLLDIEDSPEALKEKKNGQPVLCAHLMHCAETAAGLGLNPQRPDWIEFLGRCHQHEDSAIRDVAEAALFALAMQGANAAGPGEDDAVTAAAAGTARSTSVRTRPGGPVLSATGGRFCDGPQCVKSETKTGQFSACARCRAAFYCSRECQKKHWKQAHKKACAGQPESGAAEKEKDKGKGGE